MAFENWSESVSNCSFSSWYVFSRDCFSSSASKQRINLAAILYSHNDLLKIHWQNLQDRPPVISTSLSIVRWWSQKVSSGILLMFPSIQEIDGHPEQGCSSSDKWPFQNHGNHLETCVFLIAASLPAVWSTTTVSAAAFPHHRTEFHGSLLSLYFSHCRTRQTGQNDYKTKTYHMAVGHQSDAWGFHEVASTGWSLNYHGFVPQRMFLVTLGSTLKATATGKFSVRRAEFSMMKK